MPSASVLTFCHSVFISGSCTSAAHIGSLPCHEQIAAARRPSFPQQWLATPCRAAAAFFYNKDGPVSVAYISDAYRLLSPAVGTVAAKVIFGIALLASGQNSTITGTLSGGCTRQPGVCTASRCLSGDFLTCKALPS